MDGRMNRLAFLRACARVCAQMCGLQVFFSYCWVISPDDERGAPYMEMGILLLFFLLRVVDTEEEEEGGGELSPPPPPPPLP